MDSNGMQYCRFDPQTKLYKNLPNITFNLNGYEYTTDDRGNVVKVKGRLQLRDGDRKPLNDKIAGKLEGDERGHIIGDLFNGANVAANLEAMGYDLNHSGYRDIENIWKNALTDESPHEVQVAIYQKFNENGCPSTLLVAYWIDDVTSYYRRVLKNPKKE